MCIRLTNHTLLKAVDMLQHKDRLLKRIVSSYGPPPLWERKEGFATLIRIILEQQVSLASAKAAFDKLLKKTARLTPENFLALSDSELKSVGFSRQKTSYGRHLAQAIAEGNLDLAKLSTLDDVQVKKQLIAIKGIGPWTADIYLLMALGRPDVWPKGDIALAAAVQDLMGEATRPTPEALSEISRKWKPWRGVAARILWHYYLSAGK